jgi:phosphonate transport system substrate-binding protein
MYHPLLHRPLRFATYLAPNFRPVYEFVARYVGDRLGCTTELIVGDSYARIGDGDVAFLCGLPYVRLAEQPQPPIELLAAPVLQGARYGGRPVYFSDVIVRRDSRFHTFANLRGERWAYDEPNSHSGFGVVRYHLARLGETSSYFSRVIKTGWHERSIRLVAAGTVDASAIDSQVLAVTLREHPYLARRLRVIDVLGPSTIQPVVAARRLPERLKAQLRSLLLEMHQSRASRAVFAHGCLEKFVAIKDHDYDDIRAMLSTSLRRPSGNARGRTTNRGWKRFLQRIRRDQLHPASPARGGCSYDDGDNGHHG